MTRIPIVKMHASSNDILVIDYSRAQRPPSNELASLATALCDRDRSFGADGIYCLDDRGGADFFNPDGSSAEVCGNGLRCVARYLLEGAATDTGAVSSGGSLYAVRLINPAEAEVAMAPATSAVDVADADVEAVVRVVPSATRWGFLNAPNPHLVIEVASFSEEELVETARVAVGLPAFTAGINVSFILRLSGDEMFIRTHERGAGLTLACGSAMLAAYTFVSQRSRDPLTFRAVGGAARLSWNDGDHGERVVLAGNATRVWDTEMESAEMLLPPERRTGIPSLRVHMDEIDAFSEERNFNTRVLTAAAIVSDGLRLL